MPDPDVLRLRVPRDNHTWLLYPRESVDSLLVANEQACTRFPDWVHDLRRRARREVLLLSGGYLQESAGTLDSDLSCFADELHSSDRNPVLLVGGHQPELFHPGVWFKNILLNRLSSSFNRDTKRVTRSLHVIIDHDLARATSLRVPYWDNGELYQKQAMLPHSSRSSLLPWQNMILPWQNMNSPNERVDEISSEELSHRWGQCIEQIHQDSDGVGVEPMIAMRRSEFLDHVRRSPNLGEAFTRFRQSVERSHGIGNHEVPMSRICGGQCFGEFVFHCIRRHRELHEIYNRCRDVYRQERDIKNPAQPVPPLQTETIGSIHPNETDWFEMPFWMYRDLDYHRHPQSQRAGEDEGERQRMWCRLREDTFELTASPADPANANMLRLTGRMNAEEWGNAWKEWTDLGICIRPRALMTTLFLRYFVADLFVHGIGGGLYDALTDAIASEFLQVEPMRMLIASASCHLPMRAPQSQRFDPEESLEISELKNTRHRLRSAPETFLDIQNPEHALLLERHRTMIQQIPPKGARKVWYQSMLLLRQEIRTAVEWELEKLQSLFSRHYASQNDIRIRNSREYSFVLFPERHLVEQLVMLANEATSSLVDVASRE